MTWMFLGYWLLASIGCAAVFGLAKYLLDRLEDFRWAEEHADVSPRSERFGRSLTEAQQRQVFDAVVRGR